MYSKYDEYHEEVIRDVLNFFVCSFGQKCIVSQMGLATGPQRRCWMVFDEFMGTCFDIAGLLDDATSAPPIPPLTKQ